MMKRYISILTIFLLGLSVTSCDDFFEVDPDDKLLGGDYPTTLTELYSGFMGITAKVQSVADKALYLEGLRGNFLEPTANATDDIIDIYNYNDLNNNEFASPVQYYEVILNANDYIEHATKFYTKYPTSIDTETFDALVGGAIRYKCWAYLMLAKIYGEAVWVDEPLVEYQDISKYPLIKMETVIDSCIIKIERGIKINGRQIDGKGTVRWATILNASGLEWNRFCPPAEALLAELYLFAQDYQKVLDYGYAMLRLGADDSATKPSYSITLSEYNNEWSDLFRRFTRTEAVCFLPYDYDKKQTNNIINYFYNDPICEYLMRPSQAMIDMFASQFLRDGTPGDKWRSNNKTYATRNGELVVLKYMVGEETADKIFRNDTPISLYRSADIHLFIIEALVAQQRLHAASVLFEEGVATYYSDGAFKDPIADFPLSLYGEKSADQNVGIRGRVDLQALILPHLKSPAADIRDDMRQIDEYIVNETCMESAGEGRALYAMIRAAKRWNDASFVADRVSAKYPEGKRQEIWSKLQNEANWFIKYDLKNN